MAETFEAIRRGPSGFSQRVCLKLVLPFFRDNDDFIRLFEREARLAAQLRHGNIVGVIDFGEIEGMPYMALELVDGVDLEQLLEAQDRRRLSHEYVALLGHELAAALEHAHNPPLASGVDEPKASAIVHRDISPSNVLVSRHGEIMLTDFGVAKAITGTSRKQSAVKGKIPYMSPEQLRAESVDGRSDLFALGVVMFEALSGQRPFDGAHDPATIMLILEGDHPSLCTLVPKAPPELCHAIESLLVPDPGQRPQSATELIDSLDAFVPSSRIRRQLGKMVAATRAEKEKAIGGDPGVIGHGATELASGTLRGLGHKRADPISSMRQSGRPRAGDQTSWPGVGGPGAVEHAGPLARMSRRRLAMSLTGMVLALGGVAAGTFALWPRGEAGGPPSPPQPIGIDDEPKAVGDIERQAEPEPAADASKNSDTADARPDTGGEESKAPRPEVVPRRPAQLTVVVFPWGQVWVNGKARGSAPLRNESLKPGRYTIGVGQGTQSETRTVRLRSGEKKTLRFDLTE
jgi:hypothetical protein